jgi:hypothetical protein
MKNPKRSAALLRRVVLPVAGVLSTILLAAPAAQAFDLTGTWEGKGSCKGFISSTSPSFSPIKQQYSESLGGALKITQSGSDLNVSLGSTMYNGRAAASTENPDKGLASMRRCGVDDTYGSGTSGEVWELTANVPASGGTAKLKGTMAGDTMLGTALSTAVCRIKLKRSSTAMALIAASITASPSKSRP